MFDFFIIIIQIAIIILFADLLSGFVHWIQDRYSIKNTSLLNKIVILYAKEHHENPEKILSYSWIERNHFPIIVSFFSLLVLHLLNLLNWQSITLIILFLFSGEFHYLSHRPKEKNGKIILFLQKIRIIQREEHHKYHHIYGIDNYCIITEVMNPILNKSKFFIKLENLLSYLFNINPKPSSL